VLILIFLLLFNLGLFSYENEDSFKFLLFPLNASSLGVGGGITYGNVGNEYLNPAMIIENKDKMVEFSFLKWFENINLNYLGFVYPLELKNMSFGGGITYLNTGDVPGYDESGNYLGDMSVSNWIAGFSFSRRLVSGEVFSSSFGLGFRVLSVDLMGETGSGMGLNSGVSISIKRRVFMGVSVKNFGSGVKVNEVVNSLPQVVTGNFCYKGDSLSFYLEKEDDIFKGGVEFALTDQIVLRGGYRNLPDLGKTAGITLGIGFRESVSHFYLQNILAHFDYALSSFGELGFVHSFSLGIKF